MLSHEQAHCKETELKYFLEHATENWPTSVSNRSFQLFDELIKCVYWEGRYFITGADVIKIVQWRLKMANISILNFQKFEQQVYSDLRRLRIGKDAIIEEADSNFLRFLDALNSVKTRKKQKVFFWESVSHEGLFHRACHRQKKAGLKRIANLLLSLGSSVTSDHDIPSFSSGKPIEQSQPQQLQQPQQPLLPSLSTLFPEMKFESSNTNMMPPSLQPESDAILFEPKKKRKGKKGMANSDKSCKRFVCRFKDCGLAYRRKQHLNRHEYTHTEIKPYFCPFPQCGRWFSRTDNLKNHLLLHER